MSAARTTIFKIQTGFNENEITCKFMNHTNTIVSQSQMHVKTCGKNQNKYENIKTKT